MKYYRPKITERELISVTCDCCGNPTESYIDIKQDWGYESEKDGERWEAQICEVCVDTQLRMINWKKQYQATLD